MFGYFTSHNRHFHSSSPISLLPPPPFNILRRLLRRRRPPAPPPSHPPTSKSLFLFTSACTDRGATTLGLPNSLHTPPKSKFVTNKKQISIRFLKKKIEQIENTGFDLTVPLDLVVAQAIFPFFLVGVFQFLFNISFYSFSKVLKHISKSMYGCFLYQLRD